VETLLKTCPGMKILVTSREVLGLEGECFYPVPSLSVPGNRDLKWMNAVAGYEALQLFVERSRLVSPNFDVTEENFPFVIEICNQLDGIPLAIEFAAARVDMFRVEEIVNQLNRSFDLLAGSKRSVSPRHQTLRASINWSWNLLTNSEHIFMRRLSVFPGEWTFQSARAVCACENLELMSALAKKSLIVVNQEARHETRYHFHNMVRKYAREKLLESVEEKTMRDRHLDFFLEMAQKFEPALRGVDQLSWLERLFIERDNIRAAMQWAAQTNVNAGLYLSERLQAFWENYDLPGEKRWLLMI
jgi:predicted ATPase